MKGMWVSPVALANTTTLHLARYAALFSEEN
jgi:hypothetical protein